MGTRLFGRDTELARLGDAVAHAREGIPTCVVIEGDAGIGKSRLVAEALAAFRDTKDRVALGHGIKLAGGELPYGTISETLRTLVRDTSREATRAAAGPYADQLAALCPSLGPTSDRLDRLQLLPGYVTALENLADDRLVWLVIEDLHWVDASSRDLLTYLVRVAGACQLLILLTVRTHDPGVESGIADLTYTLAALDFVTRLTVTPLTDSESIALVADLTAGSATDAQVSRVVALAQGSPLLVEQLVASGLDPSAESVTGPMTARIRALDPGARQLVQIASLAEEHLTHRLLEQAYGRDGFDGNVNVALDANVLAYEPARSTYRFHHALLRQAAEDSLTPADRMAGHRRWAELLSQPANKGAGFPNVIAAAHHWAKAEVDDMAFDAAVEAARIAADLAAPAEAATHLMRVLALWERIPDPEVRAANNRDGVLVDAVSALMFSGGSGNCLSLLDAELTRLDGNRVRTLCLRLFRESSGRLLGGQSVDPSVYDEALLQVDKLLAAAPTALTIAGLGALGWAVRFTDADLSFRLHERAFAEVREIGLRAQLGRQPLLDVVQQLANRGRTDEALTLCTEAWTENQGVVTVFSGEVDTAFVLCEAGRFAEAAEVVGRGLARLADPRVSPNRWAWGSLLLIGALEALGEWDQAQARIDELAVLEYESHDTALFVAAQAGLIACFRGDTQAAQHLATQARTLATGGEDDPQCWAVVIELDAAIELAKGNYAVVRGPVLSLLQTPFLETFSDGWLVLLAAARAEGDRADQAGTTTDNATAEALQFLRTVANTLPGANAYNEARHLQALADLNRAEGTDTAATWEEVVHAWRRIGYVHNVGWALLRQAAAHVRTNDKAAAAAPLNEAWAIAHQLGAAPLTDCAVSLARRARIRLGSGVARQAGRAAGLLGSLTVRELEVLRHIALGESNGELAAALFISPKTASVHVSRILSKLDVPSRAKATALAYEEGLFAGE